MSRPEERGEDLSNLGTAEAVSRLSRSKDMIERRKLAQVIGDRSLSGTLQLSEPEKEQVRHQVTNLLSQAKSPDPNQRAEARQQIERLWHAAAPTLIASISPREVTASELAVKSLILMRNEAIVNDLVRAAKSTADEGRRQMLLFALSHMKEHRESLIRGRACLGEKESDELYQRVVVPALESLRRPSERSR